MTSTPESADLAESTDLAEPTDLRSTRSEAADAAGAAPSDPAVEPRAASSTAQPPVLATPTPQELELAAAALHEVTPRGAVGHVLDALLEGGDDDAQVLAIRHESALPGYPDWTWTVLLSRGVEGGPTVLEVALLPGDTSLLAPAWVPWSERLADYLAAKEAAGEDDEDLESDLESDLEDDFDDDFDDEDEDDAAEDDAADDDGAAEPADGWDDAADDDEAEPLDGRG